MTSEERDSLVEAFRRAPYDRVGAWTFYYESPGYFVYSNPSHGLVYFTPDAAEPGAVSIDLFDQAGDPQGSGRIPFTSMQAEDLFAIVRPFLKAGAGRKDWDPRVTTLGVSDPQSSEEELLQDLQSYLSRHDSFAGESYDFDIKARGVNIPEVVHQHTSQQRIDNIVQTEMEFRLREFIDELKHDFPWVYDTAQAGRSGGWLVIQPDAEVMDEQGIPHLESARRRLRDLEEISQRVKEGIRGLKEDLATLNFWSDRVSAPILPSRKDWDPRDPQK